MDPGIIMPNIPKSADFLESALFWYAIKPEIVAPAISNLSKVFLCLV